MARINIEQLKSFLMVVKLGGVRKASLGMNLTQPAITARIKNLEASLSCKLFDRSSGGLKLTKRGERLLLYAEQFAFLAELVERDVIDPSGVDGTLRLGVSETIAQCWLPDFIWHLHKLLPQLEIEFNVDISINLRESLLNQQIDMAILLGPISEYSVDNLDLPDFDLAWYASTSLPQERDDRLLSTKPVLTYARRTRPYRELKEKLFEHVGPGVSLFPSSSLSACFRLVEAGLGVAALPKALGREYVANGKIREFDPGWIPGPLRFTVSYFGDPRSHMVEIAAKAALEIAIHYDKNI